MKKIYIVLALLLAAGVGYGAAQIQIKVAQAKTITQYVGSSISRYDLSDTECFVESTRHKYVLFEELTQTATKDRFLLIAPQFSLFSV